jgi:hypothetical protein
MQKRFKPRSTKGATEIAQFPLTIYCLFLVVLLPVLNLVTVLVAGCTAYLATNDLAAKAATQSTFAQALNAMTVEAYNFQSNGLAQFVKMAPQGGYTGCGNDLYVLATNIGGSGVQSSPADQSLASNIDTTKNIYEMQVVSSYTVSPLVSMASFPLLGSIPGLGQPITLSFAASRPIEHPGGMQTATNGGSTATVTPFNRIADAGPGVPPPPTPVTWRNPSIFQQILAAGQTVVTVNVVTIFATQDWQSSGVVLNSSEKVWIDTQAVGIWGQGPTQPTYNTMDANGFNYPMQPSWLQWAVYAGAPGDALIGCIGKTPPTVSDAGPQRGPWNMFNVGDVLTNYPINAGGPLTFRINDNSNLSSWAQANYNGEQLVRVIVTR